MDLSAFIFVALAAAWTAYLVPKALRHHEEAVRHRSVERFSDTMRVLAHREPVDSRTSRLVVDVPHAAGATAAAEVAAVATSVEVSAFDRRAHRMRVQRATRRRRTVLLTLLLVAAGVTALAGLGVVPWLSTAVPAALLVAWLVACRVMVRSEHAAVASAVQPAAEPMTTATAEAWADADTSTSIPAVRASEASIDPTLWDPVPVTLPTYVSKPAAPRRRVQSIELDDSGVWSSGRSELDSLLAREAEAVERERQRRADEQHRALGS